MIRLLPNLLTMSRLPLAAAIFVILSQLDLSSANGPLLLDFCLGLFVAALLTDVLDGWLARRLDVCSQNGRMIDALVDKVLICGTFVFFIGQQFVLYGSSSQAAISITAVQPWMVVVILVRELLVTGLRTTSEGRGTVFAATFFGKAKMSLQSIAIIYIFFFAARGWHDNAAAVMVRDALVWTTVVFTALSALAYVGRAGRLTRAADAADGISRGAAGEGGKP